MQDPVSTAPGLDPAWVELFHSGDRSTLEHVYRDYFELVEHAVGRHLQGADRETVIHSVFCDLCASARMRRSFHDGSLGAWLGTVAKNRAIDHLRKHKREALLPNDRVEAIAGGSSAPLDDQLALNQLVTRMHRVLPDKLRAVFEARFVNQQSQRQAARDLSIRRTTLAYREHRVRKILRHWAKKGDLP